MCPAAPLPASTEKSPVSWAARQGRTGVAEAEAAATDATAATTMSRASTSEGYVSAYQASATT